MKTPEIIFLQWHGDCHPEDCCNDDDVDPSGASWCWEQIFPADIKYVRMDKFNEVKKQWDELQEAVKAYFVARDEVDRLTKTVTAWTHAKVGTPGEIIRASTVMHKTRAKINALLGIKAEG